MTDFSSGLTVLTISNSYLEFDMDEERDGNHLPSASSILGISRCFSAISNARLRFFNGSSFEENKQTKRFIAKSTSSNEVILMSRRNFRQFPNRSARRLLAHSKERSKYLLDRLFFFFFFDRSDLLLSI